MPDPIQNDLSRVTVDAKASAVHAGNRFVAMLKDNALYVAGAGAVLLLILAAVVFL